MRRSAMHSHSLHSSLVSAGIEPMPLSAVATGGLVLLCRSTHDRTLKLRGLASERRPLHVAAGVWPCEVATSSKDGRPDSAIDTTQSSVHHFSK